MGIIWKKKSKTPFLIKFRIHEINMKKQQKNQLFFGLFQ
jgi:hypothetical protein